MKESNGQKEHLPMVVPFLVPTHKDFFINNFVSKTADRRRIVNLPKVRES